MSRRVRMTVAVLFTLGFATTAALAPSVAGARPRPSTIAILDPTDLWTRLWNRFARSWGKNGSLVDPNGRPVPDPSADRTGLPSPLGETTEIKITGLLGVRKPTSPARTGAAIPFVVESVARAGSVAASTRIEVPTHYTRTIAAVAPPGFLT